LSDILTDYCKVKTGIYGWNLIDESEKKFNKLKHEMENIRYKSILKKYKENPFSIVSGRKYDSYSENYTHDLKQLFINNGSTEGLTEFIFLKVEKSLTDRYKIRKNDIFDFLISSYLCLQGFKFITLDGCFIKSLEIIDNNSYDLIK